MSATLKHSEERLMKVLVGSDYFGKGNHDCRKERARLCSVSCLMPPNSEIKAAVEMLFKVEVLSVQTVNRMGKQKRSGRFTGRRNHTKNAFVCLKPGQEINFTEEAA